MNLRLAQFSLGPGSADAAQAIADEVVPIIRAQSGCAACTFFADYEAGDYGIVVLWASKDDAVGAAKVVSPILTAALADASSTSDSRRLFDVYEPRGT